MVAGRKVVVVTVKESTLALEWVLNNNVFSSLDELVIVRSLFVEPSWMLFSKDIDMNPYLAAREEDLTQQIFARAREICNKHGVEATIKKLEGDPRISICCLVEELEPHLLVLGTPKHWLWRLARHCIRKVKCPVLVMPRTML